jgi:hypothetical protein
MVFNRAGITSMARPRPGFYSTIEYIGPRPQKPKRRNFFGGWVILVIAVGIASWLWPAAGSLPQGAQQGVSMEQAALLISSLEESGETGSQLAAIALAHSGEGIVFDPAYYKISYPNGDIAPARARPPMWSSVAYRKLGIDLQQEVHEDMVANFRAYPQLWEPSPGQQHRPPPHPKSPALLRAQGPNPHRLPRIRPTTSRATSSSGRWPTPKNTSASWSPAPATALEKRGSSTIRTPW